MRTELFKKMTELCDELGISKPSIKTSSRKYGCYWPSRQIINLGQINLKNDDMFKQVFIHEFTHHVDHQLNAGEWRDRTHGRRTRRSHDRKFYKLLLRVIDKFYGDRSVYPWRWEYKTLADWARWAG